MNSVKYFLKNLCLVILFVCIVVILWVQAMALAASLPTCAYSYDYDLEVFQRKLVDIYEEDILLYSRIDKINNRIGTTKTYIRKAKDIANILIGAKEELDRSDDIFKLLKGLPVVGGAVKSVDAALDYYVRRLLDRTYGPAKRIKSVLKKAEWGLDKAEFVLDRTLEALLEVQQVTSWVDLIVCYGDNCATQSALHEFVDVGTYPADFTLDLLQATNNSLDTVEVILNETNQYLKAVPEDLLKNASVFLSTIEGVLDLLSDINNLFDRRVCVRAFWVKHCTSIRDVLNNSIGMFIDLVEDTMKPITNELYNTLDNIELLSLPTLDFFLKLEYLPVMPDLNIPIYIPFIYFPSLCDMVEVFGTCVPGALREDLGCRLYCGDGICYRENCSSCSWDCGECAPYCGDGKCNGSENCSSCSRDCGECAPYCGDGKCNGNESSSTCPRDCRSSIPKYESRINQNTNARGFGFF